jgi:hypothetical protein
MKFFNNFNEMYSENCNNNPNVSVFNWEWHKGDYDEICYTYESWYDGTAEMSVMKTYQSRSATYYDPPEYDTYGEELNIDFKTDEGFEFLNKWEFLYPVDKAKELDMITGNTTNEPITKENWKEVANTTFDWKAVLDCIDDWMDLNMWEDLYNTFDGYMPDFYPEPPEY